MRLKITVFGILLLVSYIFLSNVTYVYAGCGCEVTCKVETVCHGAGLNRECGLENVCTEGCSSPGNCTDFGCGVRQYSCGTKCCRDIAVVDTCPCGTNSSGGCKTNCGGDGGGGDVPVDPPIVVPTTPPANCIATPPNPCNYSAGICGTVSDSCGNSYSGCGTGPCGGGGGGGGGGGMIVVRRPTPCRWGLCMGSCGVGVQGNNGHCGVDERACDTGIPCNTPPVVTSLTLKNSLGAVVSFDTGNKNNICKPGFSNDKTITFEFLLTDAQGGNDITSAQMRWNGLLVPLSLGSVSGNNRIATVTVNFTGVNNATTYPIEIIMNDTIVSTGWINSIYSFKSWDCVVPVSGTIFDGSAGQSCPTNGFSLLADAKINFNNMVFSIGTGNNTDISVIPLATFGTNNLMWDKSYIPLLNGGSETGNIDGDLMASGRFTRLIDAGVGTTICPSNSRFNVYDTVSAYSTNPRLIVELSYIRDQEGWFQGRGVDIRAKGEVSSGVPVTALSYFSIDNVDIGSSNNGVVAGNGYRNINGWNDSSAYGYPNNWHINNSFSDPQKDSYNIYLNEFLGRYGMGTTGVTNIAVGSTGLLFVSGDLNINSDVVVPTNQYLMVIVSGKINIGIEVSQLDGIYVANKGIEAIGVSDNQLVINGMLYSTMSSNIRLARSFTDKSLNNATPAIVVNYRPDMIFAIPGKLFRVLTGWREL